MQRNDLGKLRAFLIDGIAKSTSAADVKGDVTLLGGMRFSVNL